MTFFTVSCIFIIVIIISIFILEQWSGLPRAGRDLFWSNGVVYRVPAETYPGVVYRVLAEIYSGVVYHVRAEICSGAIEWSTACLPRYIGEWSTIIIIDRED